MAEAVRRNHRTGPDHFHFKEGLRCSESLHADPTAAPNMVRRYRVEERQTPATSTLSSSSTWRMTASSRPMDGEPTRHQFAPIIAWPATVGCVAGVTHISAAPPARSARSLDQPVVVKRGTLIERAMSRPFIAGIQK